MVVAGGPGGFAQALGGPARGGHEQHPGPQTQVQVQDATDDGGLAGAGAAGDDQDLLFEGRGHGLGLLLGELEPLPGLHLGDQILQVQGRGAAGGGGQASQGLGHPGFRHPGGPLVDPACPGPAPAGSPALPGPGVPGP